MISTFLMMMVNNEKEKTRETEGDKNGLFCLAGVWIQSQAHEVTGFTEADFIQND